MKDATLAEGCEQLLRNFQMDREGSEGTLRYIVEDVILRPSPFSYHSSIVNTRAADTYLISIIINKRIYKRVSNFHYYAFIKSHLCLMFKIIK